jgi:hypothetical protein
MGWKRRQVLALGGAFIGVGCSALAQKLMAASPDALILVQNPFPEDLINPPRGDVRIAVISDLNRIYGSTTYDEEVIRGVSLLPYWQPDLVLCGGDMVAGQDIHFSRSQIEAMWAGFDRLIAQPIRQAGLPFGFTLGNHDASRAVRGNTFIYQQERDLAAAYWNAPDHDPGLAWVDRHHFPFYYTFQQNDIFYLVWDASSGLRMPPDDLAWVERSLASEAAQAAKLRIVVGHLPLYAVAVGRDRVGEVLTDAERLHSLLERYHVHTYISGHHHAYYPGHLGQLQLLHAGALGSGSRQLLNSTLPPRKTLTLIDINLSAASTTYTTFDIQALSVIEQQELPRSITASRGFVMRRDLDWEDLTPTEQAACRQRLAAEHCQT